MAKFPNPVTADNFQEAVSSVNTFAAYVKRKNVTKNIVRPIASLLFCVLSLLLVIGAIYNASSPEEMVVYEQLGFVVDAWTAFSGLFVNSDMVWFVSWGILIAAAYIIPLIVSAVISIPVALLVKASPEEISAGTEAQKAKQLYTRAQKVAGEASNVDSSSIKTLFKWLFVLALVAFLLYAFLVLKVFGSFDVATLVGLVLVMAIVYFVYGLLFRVFYALNSLFYKKKPVPYNIASIESYWLSVDPEEVQRREEEAKRQAELAEQARAQAAARSSSGGGIDRYDSFTWTYGYVRDNEKQCSDTLLSVLRVSKDLLRERNYSDAAAGFDKIVHGLEMLVILDEGYYSSPLYANCYALSRIFAFGLNNKAAALTYAEKACEYAITCGTDMAKRDFYKMSEYRDALRTSRSLSSIASEFKLEFPYDILSSN